MKTETKHTPTLESKIGSLLGRLKFSIPQDAEILPELNKMKAEHAALCAVAGAAKLLSLETSGSTDAVFEPRDEFLDAWNKTDKALANLAAIRSQKD